MAFPKDITIFCSSILLALSISCLKLPDPNPNYADNDINTVIRYIEAYNRRDIDTMLSYLSDYKLGKLPYTGSTITRKESQKRYYQDVFSRPIPVGWKISSIRKNGNRVIIWSERKDLSTEFGYCSFQLYEGKIQLITFQYPESNSP